MMRRVGALLVLAALVTGCDPLGKASLDPAFGARVTDGKLRIWTGSRCVGVTDISISFEPGRAELKLSSRSETGVDVEYFTLGGPYPAGLEISKPLPDGFDWRAEKSMFLSPHGGSSHWGTSTDLAEVLKGSDQHPADTYWFQGVGWLSPADVAAKDGKRFLAVCTPDPAKKR
ncbi:hypothetical protein AWC26_16650 [Mycobacterium shimoidei]|nr:hypothetical protein AWC26_16650 [Mycobacterium shimoidei]